MKYHNKVQQGFNAQKGNNSNFYNGLSYPYEEKQFDFLHILKVTCFT